MHLLPRTATLSLTLIAVGLTSTVGQLILLRELVAVFYGNELVLGLILAGWLAWAAAGAWVLGRRSGRAGRLAMAAGLAAAAGILPTQVALVRASRSLMGVTPGTLVAFAPMVLAILLILAPLCLLLGWQFTLGARLLSESGGSVGGAYVVEGLGAVAGGALFSFVLVRWLDPFQMALGTGAFNLAVAAALLRRGRWLAVASVGILTILTLPLGRWLHQATLDWQYSDLRFARDSVYGRIAVTGSGQQRVFYENGLLFFETQGVAAEEVAHLPLLAHPRPERVLLIGGGVSGTLAEILRHPSVREVHYVELDPLVVTAARSELPPDQAAVLDDTRVTLVHVDGRIYVEEQQEEKPFDAVILDLPEPATSQINRFYTEEFFAQVENLLAPGGILSLSLPWQENYPGPALQRLAASIYQALGNQFPELAVLPGGQLFLLASDAPLPADPGVFESRLAEREIVTRWVVPSYLDYSLTTNRTSQARQLLDTAGGVRPNRDLEPISSFYGLAVWLSRLSGSLERLASAAPLLRLGWLAVPLAVLVIVVRYAPWAGQGRWSVPAVTGLTGLAQMTMQVVVLLTFQVVHGYIYGQVGLITTAFMAGLVLGGTVANRWRWPEAPGRWRSLWSRSSPRSALAWVQAGTVLFAGSFVPLAHLAPPPWAFPVLALAAGGLTGLAFPLAVACMPASGEGAGRVAGLLYGVDLAGGCTGAALAGVLLVPILGIPHTCLAVGMIGLAGLALLL